MGEYGGGWSQAVGIMGGGAKSIPLLFLSLLSNSLKIIIIFSVSYLFCPLDLTKLILIGDKIVFFDWS